MNIQIIKIVIIISNKAISTQRVKGILSQYNTKIHLNDDS